MSETFIHELSLIVSFLSLLELDSRLEAGGFLYNAMLQESLRRLKLMRESKEWQKARALIDRKEKNKAFKKIIRQRKFTEYDLHRYLTDFLKGFPLRSKLDSQCCQKIASRAFSAAKEYSLGKRGRPRFKGRGQFSSLEGKSNITGIRFIDGFIKWKGLKLKAIFDQKDRFGVEAHALNCPVKYVRLVRRTRKGTEFFCAQLILEGRPKVKYPTSKKHAGLDLGPSNVALYSEKAAFLEPFTDSKIILIKRLERKISRSFEKNQKTTKRCRKLRGKITELKRKDSLKRKHELGFLINRILSLGTIIHLEKLSYVSFQKNFGKSVQKHAPGQFVERLKRKAENAGGRVEEINPYLTKLSQVCICGRTKQKALSLRTHECPCGIKTQRDLFSAFLAFHTENNLLDRSQAFKACMGAQSLLKQALSGSGQIARIGKSSNHFERRQSGSPVKDGSTHIEVEDAVGYPLPRASKRYADIAVRTP